jgi:hypothetical protein
MLMLKECVFCLGRAWLVWYRMHGVGYGKVDETRQDRLWGTIFLCCRCYEGANGRQGKVQGANGSESLRALAIRSLNLTHLGQVETHDHPSLTSHSLERGPWGQAP